MAKEIENEETIESTVDQVTASQKLDQKAKKEKKKRARRKVFKVLLAVMLLPEMPVSLSDLTPPEFLPEHTTEIYPAA